MSNEVGQFLKCPFGFQIAFPNGWTASVQWGWGNYCRNHNNIDDYIYNPDFLSSPNAELAAFPTDGHRNQDHWYKFPDNRGYGVSKFSNDVVKGWQSVSEVMEFLNLVQGFLPHLPGDDGKGNNVWAQIHKERDEVDA